MSENTIVKNRYKKTKNEENKNLNSKFVIIEAYKQARANLMFTLSSNDNNAFTVTSWSKGEGKSTVATNLAVSFSKTGKKTLLIDSDLRRPNIHLLMDTSNSIGFSDVLSGTDNFDDAVHKEVHPNLDVLTAGNVFSNPSELLCSPVLPDLIKQMKSSYDYVIFDSPPIGVVSDALLLKQYVYGYVAVVRENRTTHKDIEKMIRSVELAKSNIMGFIKTGCKVKKHSSKRYGYYYDTIY